MPDALAALYAGAQAVGAWLGSTAVASLTWAQVITTTFAVYGTVNAREGARRSRNQARDAYNAGLTDRTVTFTDPNAPWQICYGEPAVGGRVAAMLTSGDRDQYKHLVVVWADHECDAITETYLAGVALGTLDGNGDVTTGKWLKELTGTTTTTVVLDGAGHVDLGRPGASLITLSFEIYVGDYITNGVLVAADWTVSGNTITLTAGHVAAWAGRTVQANFSDNATQPMVRVRHYLGGAGQVADAQLITDCPGDWSSTDVLTGKCYSILRFNLDEPEFQSGPPALKVRLRGKKLYDHRTLATTWSANPALCVADFLMGEYGKQQPSNAIDWATVDAAANVCDEALASHGGAARYRCDGAVQTDADTDQTLDALCQSMAGFATDAGAWRLQAGAYTAPVMALTVADNAGGIELLAGAAGLEVFNGLRGKYFDPERFDQLTDYTPYQNTAFVTADGGVAMWGSLNLPFTAADWRATNLARIQVERSRGQQLVFPAKLRAVRLKVGQRVTLTVPWLNLDAAVLRLVKKEFKPGGAVMLSMEQDDASYYDEADAPAPLASPTASAQDPWVVAPVAGLVAVSSDAIALRDTDGTVVSRVLVNWTASSDTLVSNNGALQLEYRLAESAQWTRVPEINPAATSHHLLGLQNNRLYILRARWRNGIGALSDWRIAFVVSNVGAASASAYYTATVYLQVGSAPSAPTGGSFNFGTGALTAPGGWTISQPATTTTPTYACEYTFGTATPGATVTAGTWSAPYIDAVAGAPGGDGDMGPAGESVLVLEVYLQAASAPATPSGGSYTFSTDSFTAPAGGWSRDMPTSSSTPTWRAAYRFATNTPAVAVTAGSYSAPVAVAQNGVDGTNGTPGAPGADGSTSYFHVKYSNDGGATFTASSGETPGAYIGTYTDFTLADSTSVGAYTWALIKGADGTNGTPGAPGADGQTSYLHIKWSNDGGATFTASSGETPGAYIGTYTDFTLADSTSVGAYTWALIKGADGTNGTPGAPGADGQTSYLHIKWSNDGGSTFTASSGETPGTYIGTYTDFTLADSTSVGAYTWALVKGADGTSAAPTVQATVSAAALSLPADSSGAVTSFSLAATTMSLTLDLVADTSNWTITRSNGTGVTTSIAGATVSVTALSVDSSYFDIIATDNRSLYPTQTIRVGVNKVRSLTVVGMNPGFSVYVDDVRIGPSGTAKAEAIFGTDGRVQQVPQNGTSDYGGNWYTPTTGGIGSTYAVRLVLQFGDAPSGVTLGAWTSLSSAVSVYLTTGTTGVLLNCELYAYIALASDTTRVLAQGFITLSAEKT